MSNNNTLIINHFFFFKQFFSILKIGLVWTEKSHERLYYYYKSNNIQSVQSDYITGRTCKTLAEKRVLSRNSVLRVLKKLNTDEWIGYSKLFVCECVCVWCSVMYWHPIQGAILGVALEKKQHWSTKLLSFNIINVSLWVVLYLCLPLWQDEAVGIPC